ncbi:MAG: amidohydrolase family protein [Alphaproteobacteria bacterium]|nr:amidohydrolase family protein [Alphaproteobacteria bacterium]MBV9904823.1 amidohydrolase family protein [Alphaproteobacteria bacterium]
MAADYDLVIRNGQLADGTGAPLRTADIAVKDGKIAAVGAVSGGGKEEIDATGKLVTPGFVDIHTHYDGQATWDSQLNPSSWHGVTTVVMGNCGVGFAPVRKQDHNRLIELMEGVEDIPGVALHEGLKWNWESFGEYLNAVESTPHDIDVAAQLPHGALRVYVMGERGAKLEAATDEDIAEMRRITADAMRAGAIGFSTSRTLNHKTVTGDPTPALRATEAELTGIALGIKDAGKGVIEMISDFNQPDLPTEFGMIRRLVETSGRPLTLSLAQGHSYSEGWRRILELIEKSSEAGLPIKAQVAPRPIGVLLGLQGTINPFITHKAFQEIKDKPLADKVKAMRDPAFRARILDESAEREKAHPLARGIMAFDRMFPLGDPPNYEPPKESSIAAMAARSNRTAPEIAYDLLLEDEGRAFLFSPFANYANFNLDHIGEMIAHKDCVMGLGDGGAHVGIISDASFITYLITHWGRDRAKGKFEIPFLVKRQTADTARAVGLNDRGIVAPGMKADLNIIDIDKLAVEAPTMAYDLPAGGKRLLQGAKGYDATIVSGQVIYRNGKHTGALPGKLVRGPQPAPVA